MSGAANVTEWMTRTLQIVTNSHEHPGGLWFDPAGVPLQSGVRVRVRRLDR